ncbi:hypothetical protein EMCRGX_G023005 [Ephydatia muelleri]
MLIAMTLALQKLVSSLDADEECAEILLQAWYLDNGALAGTRSAVLRALHLIEELSPALGLHVNLAKCSRRGNTSFPPEVRCSLLPNLYIIGSTPVLPLYLPSARPPSNPKCWLPDHVTGEVSGYGKSKCPNRQDIISCMEDQGKQQGIQRVTLLHSRADLVK